MTGVKLFSCVAGDRPLVGARQGETDFDLSAWLGARCGVAERDASDLAALLGLGILDEALWEEFDGERRAGALEERRLAAGSYRLLPPVPRPGKILAVGRNYAAHALETGSSVPEEPMFFSKLPSALIAHGEAVPLPRQSSRVDHEAELALVIGRAGKNIREKEALDHVFGYAPFNDVTARDLQREDQGRGRPWTRSKSFDGFAPMGPFLVPAPFVAGPGGLRIECRVGGALRQEGNTSDMIYPVSVLVARISAYCTLRPGDVIATGTPEGVGPLEEGDVVEVTVEGLGTLRNPVVRGEAP